MISPRYYTIRSNCNWTYAHNWMLRGYFARVSTPAGPAPVVEEPGKLINPPGCYGHSLQVRRRGQRSRMEKIAEARVVARAGVRALWVAMSAAALSGFPLPGAAAPAERIVFDHTLVSEHDPAVQIKLPGFAHYVGADRFVLTDPKLGDFDDCELHAFVDSEGGRRIRKLYWVQFEAYLPSQPSLHHTYKSPRHLTIGGLDFYLDTWVSSGSTLPEARSDDAHLQSLLAAHGYQRTDSMSVRLVHLTDATKRKELMVIYAESLAPTGYTAAQLRAGGTDRARWAAIEDGLIRRAQQSISITPAAGSRP